MKDLLKLEKEKNELKTKDNSLKVSEKVFETYNHLELSGGLEEFRKRYDYFARYPSMSNLTRFYKDLGLISSKDVFYVFSELADELYYFVFELSFSKDEKKKFKMIVEKLNNHEISIFKNYDIENNSPINLKGFNQKLVVDLEEYGFVSKKENNLCYLTYDGFVLRNIIGILNQ